MKISATLATTSLILALAAMPVALAAPAAVTLTTPFGQSTILSWSWGASNSISVGGGGPSAGTPSIQDLSVSRKTDSLSPKFLELLVKGKFMPSVELTEGPMKLTLTKVFVSSVSTGGVADRNAVTADNVTLTFESFVYTVTSAQACHNLAENTSECPPL